MCSNLKLMQNHNGKICKCGKDVHSLTNGSKKKLSLRIFPFFKFTGILLACVSIPHGGQKTATGLQELELHTDVSCHVDAGDQRQVFCKSNKHS